MISTVCRIDAKDSQKQLTVTSVYGSTVLLTFGDKSIEVDIDDLVAAVRNCQRLGEATFVIMDEKPKKSGFFKRE